MEDFFKVKNIDEVLAMVSLFLPMEKETITLSDALGRILGSDIKADSDLPGFARAVMDGFAVQASSTFGAGEANPAYLTLTGDIPMGQKPDFILGHGEAAGISTGGRLPKGADSVVMVEYTNPIDRSLLEIYKSAAPGQHVIDKGEDFKLGDVILPGGWKLRPQDIGLLAAFGHESVDVFKKPLVAIISTGDELVPINQDPGPAQVRDINTYSLAAFLRQAGAIPIVMGVVKDDFDSLVSTCRRALEQSRMVLISGGSSVGMRDLTISALSSIPDTSVLVHGISISPGKPTILADSNGKQVWGLPGHVTSAMVVFQVVVGPFLDHLSGLKKNHDNGLVIHARLTRNLASAQGRVDYVRVKLLNRDGCLWAEPVLGKSGLINTMVKADGLVELGLNTEGMEKDEKVRVIPF